MSHAEKTLSLHKERGLTLVEIMISLLILAMLMGVVLPSVTGVTRAKLKSSAGQLASAIRYVYNFSAMQRLYCRMVFELDEGFYYTECSEEPVYLQPKKLEAKTEQEVLDEKMRKAEGFSDDPIEKDTFAMGEEEKEAWRLQNYKPKFMQVQTRIVKQTKLPPNVFFEGIWTMHQDDIFRYGDAQLYFFPQGFVEKSMIYLSSDSGKIYTLSVKPLTGKVVIHNEYIEPPTD